MATNRELELKRIEQLDELTSAILLLVERITKLEEVVSGKQESESTKTSTKLSSKR